MGIPRILFHPAIAAKFRPTFFLKIVKCSEIPKKKINKVYTLF